MPKTREQIREYQREYHKRPEVKARKRAYLDRPDVRARRNKYYEEYRRRPRSRAKRQAWERLQRYGLTQESLREMWEKQKGLCALCADPLRHGRGNAQLDHNHTTGKVRGFLCGRCNLGVGIFEKWDLSKLLEYLA